MVPHWPAFDDFVGIVVAKGQRVFALGAFERNLGNLGEMGHAAPGQIDCNARKAVPTNDFSRPSLPNPHFGKKAYAADAARRASPRARASDLEAICPKCDTPRSNSRPVLPES
jgi:hypothetical protein